MSSRPDFHDIAALFPGPGYCGPLKSTDTATAMCDTVARGRRQTRYPVRPVRSDIMLTACFLVALFALIVAMHRGVTRQADAKLRSEFDAEGARADVSRGLMRAAGYSV